MADNFHLVYQLHSIGSGCLGPSTEMDPLAQSRIFHVKLFNLKTLKVGCAYIYPELVLALNCDIRAEKLLMGECIYSSC